MYVCMYVRPLLEYATCAWSPYLWYNYAIEKMEAVQRKFTKRLKVCKDMDYTVAHVHRKVSIGYNDAPQIRPQKYPFPWTDPQTPLPASSLDRPMMPNGIRIRSAAFPQWTGQTDRQIVHGKVWWLLPATPLTTGKA